MIQRILRSALGIITLIIGLNGTAWANEEKEKALSYPELEVTPRASERLRMESETEDALRWRSHLPVQLSALSTLAAGVLSWDKEKTSDNARTQSDNRDNNHFAALTAMGVGAGWLALTVYLSATYSPYENGWKSVSRLPSGSEREKLTRERVAEEALGRPASLAWKLEWLSFLTNAGANAYLLGNVASRQGIPAVVGVALSFSPFLFNYHWSDVYSTHERYKKKIYGPMASLVDVGPRGQLTPGVVWRFDF